MIKTLAYAGLLGFDPEEIMEGDSIGRAVRLDAVKQALEIRYEWFDQQAGSIINRLAKALRRGSSG